MNELHLFAGSGGGILGGILCGHRTVCAVEINPFNREILLQRQRDGILPWFPIWDDVRTFDGSPWRGFANIVCGGFPCQDISTAGGANRKGINGKQSGLWVEMARIIRQVEPRFIFVENSPALAFRGLGKVLGDMAEMGFNARWGVFSAGDVGARHKRERIWIVGIHRDANQNTTLPKQGVLQWPSETAIRAMSTWMVTEPQMGRKVDGLAGWMEQLNALGNGQVPQVAAYAWRVLTDGIFKGKRE